MRSKFFLMFGVLILQLNSSCKTQYSKLELKNNFSSEQINDLEKITDFFKDQICLNKSSNFKKCYKDLPHEYLEAVGNPVWSNINFKKQKELYQLISQTTFDEIWQFTKARSSDEDIATKAICSKYNGKYQKYLIEFGRRNKAIEDYANKIVMAGDFAPVSLHYSNIIKLKKFYDLQDPNIQLILAVHFLSLNDDIKRTDKWKSK